MFHANSSVQPGEGLKTSSGASLFSDHRKDKSWNSRIHGLPPTPQPVTSVIFLT